MTPEEWATEALAQWRPEGRDLNGCIAAAIREAVAEERAGCLAIIESFEHECGDQAEGEGDEDFQEASWAEAALHEAARLIREVRGK